MGEEEEGEVRSFSSSRMWPFCLTPPSPPPKKNGVRAMGAKGGLLFIFARYQPSKRFP